MKSIIEIAGYKAATAQLNEITTAHAVAKTEERELIAQLDATYNEEKPSALDRAKAMLKGGAAAPRQDRIGLQARLTACREKLALLDEAIKEQRGIIADVVSAQSAIVNSEAKQGHIKAAERIKSALAGLRDAMASEQALRAEIVDSGYQCHLEPLAFPDLNLADSQSTIGHFERNVNQYLAFQVQSTAKTLNVRMLVRMGENLPGDVMTLAGLEAAMLLRDGHAELTTEKPSRVTRPVRESYGHAFS